MNIVLVTGTRREHDRHKVVRRLKRYPRGSLLIVGDADGVDRVARRWWRRVHGGDCVHVYKAEWKKYGRPAGPRRNRRMGNVLAALQDGGDDVFVEAFPDAKSNGTWNCHDYAVGLVGEECAHVTEVDL